LCESFVKEFAQYSPLRLSGLQRLLDRHVLPGGVELHFENADADVCGHEFGVLRHRFIAGGRNGVR